MITGIAALDYLSVTSFNEEDFRHWLDEIQLHHGALYPERGVKRNNYTGMFWKSDAGTVFCGSGVQDKRDHYFLSVSGKLAETALLWSFRTGRSSRIDIQVTLPLPKDFSPRNFKDVLDAVEPERWPNQRKPYLELFENPIGGGVYIGSRSSDRYQRWYIKVADDGSRWLRFETQWRSRRAWQVWGRISTGEACIAPILKAEFDRLPNEIRLRDDLEPFTNFFTGHDSLPTKGGHIKGNRWRWLQDQVTPALYDALRDPDISEKVYDHFRRLLLGSPHGLSDNLAFAHALGNQENGEIPNG